MSQEVIKQLNLAPFPPRARTRASPALCALRSFLTLGPRLLPFPLTASCPGEAGTEVCEHEEAKCAEGISFSGALVVFIFLNQIYHLSISEYNGFDKHYLGCFYF